MNSNLNYLIRSFIGLILAFIFSHITCLLLIRYQKKKRIGQSINLYLNQNHQKKKDTPSMGGIGIIIGLILSSSSKVINYHNYKYSLGLVLIISFFLIGLVDDWLKEKKSYKGLSPFIRLFFELLITIFIFIIYSKHYEIELSINLTKNIVIFIGSFFPLLFVFLIIGSANAFNLTDGLDGLSGGLFLISILPLITISLFKGEYEIAFLLIQLFGATLGFLFYNIPPAKIFMGDSGSLALGSILGFVCFSLNEIRLLLTIGGIFIFETVSVILQVLSYQLKGKRIFLMTPFHHHLEMKRKNESQVVIIFYVVGFILSLIGLYIGIFI